MIWLVFSNKEGNDLVTVVDKVRHDFGSTQLFPYSRNQGWVRVRVRVRV
jgi:hypothetical protein